MPTWDQALPKSKPFKCCAAWHLLKSGQCLAIYDFLGSLTDGGKNPFFSSIQKVANYFGTNYEATRRSFKSLRKMGWLERRDERLYYVSHDVWATKRPDKCSKRDMLPWQECSDPLVGEIWRIAGGKIRVMDWHIQAIRKHIGEEDFLREYRLDMEAAALKRVPDGDWHGTSPQAVFWAVYRRLKADGAQSPTVEVPAYK